MNQERYAQEAWRWLKQADADVAAASNSIVAKRLDKLYIPTRYPSGLPDMIPAEVFTLEEAQAAVASARTIIDFIHTCITQQIPRGHVS